MSDILDRLYKDIGVKIKTLAKWTFFVAAILVLISAVLGFCYISAVAIDEVVWALDHLNDSSYYFSTDLGDVLGVVVAWAVGVILLPILAVIAMAIELVGTWPLYAFGEIVDNIVKTRKNTDILVGKSPKKVEIQEGMEKENETYEVEEEEEYKDEMPPDLNIEPNENQWRCPACKAINENYVGTCGCGHIKGAVFIAKPVEEKKPEPEIEVAQEVEVEIPAGHWKCPACNAINANYVGTCGCGQFKPLTK